MNLRPVAPGVGPAVFRPEIHRVAQVPQAGAAGVLDQPVTAEEVFEVAARRQPVFSALVRTILALS